MLLDQALDLAAVLVRIERRGKYGDRRDGQKDHAAEHPDRDFE